MNDTNVFLPSDYMLENWLSIKNCQEWLKDKMFNDDQLKEFNLVNEGKLKTFNNRKRLFIFIVGTNSKSIESFKL